MINYLCSSPLPKINSTDAVYNEISILNEHFNGNHKHITSLFPFSKPNSFYPKKLLGLHKMKNISIKEAHTSLNHIFSNGLHELPFMHLLRKPIIYTSITSITSQNKLPLKFLKKKIKKVVVSDQASFDLLSHHLPNRVKFIYPVVQTDSFITLEKPIYSITEPFNILFASAPWEKSQIHKKGIHITLDTLKKMPMAKMTFLLRDLLYEEIIELIRKYGVEQQVTVINKMANVQSIMKNTHCTILLATVTNIVKSYPNSLIESIMAKRPVITSSEIPISKYVLENNYGAVLQNINTFELARSINYIIDNYETLTHNLDLNNENHFSSSVIIKRHREVYDLD